ncbi:MAG: septal ring lytic transglycosylase RlpA family protein [Desulfocapsa sp.]|nr:septal ring lytic transglycosylase RlpA family protein [Desulfocapsa sp.]
MNISFHADTSIRSPLCRLIVFITTASLFLYFTAVSSEASSKKTKPATQRPYIVNNRSYAPLPSAEGYEETGTASWYGHKFHGRLTSNGETYNMHDITAAHKLLPMHTMLLVTNLENGRKLVVRVNDRGPFVRERIIDLSYGAAKKLGLFEAGTAKVKITALGELQKTNGEQRIIKHADLRSGEYFVQIGSFIQQYNSRKLQKKFLDAGHHTVIRKALVKEQTFYRVQVYVGQTLRGARRSELALLDKGYRGAFIVAR